MSPPPINPSQLDAIKASKADLITVVQGLLDDTSYRGEGDPEKLADIVMSRTETILKNRLTNAQFAIIEEGLSEERRKQIKVHLVSVVTATNRIEERNETVMFATAAATVASMMFAVAAPLLSIGVVCLAGGAMVKALINLVTNKSRRISQVTEKAVDMMTEATIQVAQGASPLKVVFEQSRSLGRGPA